MSTRTCQILMENTFSMGSMGLELKKNKINQGAVFSEEEAERYCLRLLNLLHMIYPETLDPSCKGEDQSSECWVRIIQMWPGILMPHLSVAVVVVAFFLCWAPFHSQRLMFVLVTLLGNWNNKLIQGQHILFMISGG